MTVYELVRRLVAGLDVSLVRPLFDDLDAYADEHTPVERQIYLALYRRLHG